MAQTGFTPIQLYSSSTPTNAPSAGNLTNDTKGSELAINIADKNLFFKDSTNAVNTVPIRQSGAASDGWLSSTDWNTFNNKQPAGTYVTSVGATAPVASSGGTTPTISMAAATTSVNGYLTSTDWNTFNGKQAALVSGTNIKTVNGTTLLGSGDVGTIGVGYGGTGLTAVTAGYVPFGNTSTALNTDAGLFWDNSNKRLAVGTTAPQFDLTVSKQGTGVTSYIGIRAGEGGSGSTSNAAVLYYRIRGGGPGDVDGSIVYSYVNASAGYALAYTANDSHIFNTASGEAARIWGSKGVSIGNTTDPGAGSLIVNTDLLVGTTSLLSGAMCLGFDGAVKYGLIFDNTSTVGSGQYAARFRQNGAYVGSIQTTSSATFYVTSSDYRLKENIAPMTGALDVVQQLKPVTYNWKVDGSSGQGFIAHELQAVVPDCVTGEKDAMRTEKYEISPAIPAEIDSDGKTIKEAVEAVMGEREVPDYQGIDTSFLVATLAAAIQEQQVIIEQLKADVLAIKGN